MHTICLCILVYKVNRMHQVTKIRFPYELYKAEACISYAYSDNAYFMHNFHIKKALLFYAYHRHNWRYEWLIGVDMLWKGENNVQIFPYKICAFNTKVPEKLQILYGKYAYFSKFCLQNLSALFFEQKNNIHKVWCDSIDNQTYFPYKFCICWFKNSILVNFFTNSSVITTNINR